MSIVRKYKISKLSKKPLEKDVLDNLKIVLKHFEFKKENFKVIDEYYDNFFNLKMVTISESIKLSNYVFYINNDHKIIFYHCLHKPKDPFYKCYDDRFFVNYNYLKQIIHSNLGVKKLSHKEMADIIASTIKYAYPELLTKSLHLLSSEIEAEFDHFYQRYV